MKISDVAKQSGLTPATIRFYERQGVLPGAERQPNGYREYTSTDADRTVNFARFRDLGIDAREAARLADQCATGQCDLTWTELGPLLVDHREKIAQRIGELQTLDARLAALQALVFSTGQSVHLAPEARKEEHMDGCTCDGGCCGGPTGPCC